MKNRIISSISSLSTLAAILTLTGCATVPARPLPAMPVLSETVANTITSCSVTPSKGQQVSVQDGDVTISIRPEIVQSVDKDWRDVVVIGGPYILPSDTVSPCWEGKAAYNENLSVKAECNVVDVKLSPYYTPVRRKLHFDVTIKNQLPIPLRLDSSLIAIYVGQETMPTENYRADYEGFRKGLILPGQEWSFKFANTNISDTIPNGSKIRIGIYDIPVKVNNNSESIKKGRWNFDFDYTCTDEVKKETPTVIRQVRLITSPMWKDNWSLVKAWTLNQMGQEVVVQKDQGAQTEKDAGWIDFNRFDHSYSGQDGGVNVIIPQKAMVLFVRPTTRASHRYSWSVQNGRELCRLGRAVSVPWNTVDLNIVSYTGAFTETGRKASIERGGGSQDFIQKAAYEGVELYGPSSACNGRGPSKECGYCDVVVTDVMQPGWQATERIRVHAK